jgi:hypothetical protein
MSRILRIVALSASLGLCCINSALQSAELHDILVLPAHPTQADIAKFNAMRGPRTPAPSPLDQFDPKDVAVAQAMFNGNEPAMLEWLENQKNIRSDQQQGHSYSFGVRRN